MSIISAEVMIMRICTFFGHSDAPEEIKEKLCSAVEDVILSHGVDMFYMGCEGKFDAYARAVVKALTEKYPHIKYNVVLAYMPSEKRYGEYMDYSDTIVFEGIEKVHPRYAIAARNEWMVKKAEYAITYVKRPLGGAYRYAEMMKKKNKTVINVNTL